MYESHFGFTAAPFSLNPDPAFFFESRGHGNALSYLKFGVYQGEGFVVVTGEIGAGKTTLVRTLLSGLEDQGIVAAQIVSTQLEAGDLLRSVALAFGIPPKNLSKAELIATIEAFLTLLVTENKRALLIVDEAQNLDREAVEELRMLSNFQLGNQALLQSFLVGQPELRVLLTSKPMEQFRQRVIASCHLGPMDRGETQAYIEHRLRQVGWSGTPSFDVQAFDRIHHWTSGIPRRVNLLCNRLLLAAYLGEQTGIDARAVDAIGEEVRLEVGELPARPAALAEPAQQATAPLEPRVPAAAAPLPQAGVDTLMCVAASAADDVKIAALLHALKQRTASLVPVRVRIGDPSAFVPGARLFAQAGIAAEVLDLDIAESTPTEQIAAVLSRFATLLDAHRPHAVVVVGGTDTALACSLAASKKACTVIHLDAGVRPAASRPREEANDALIDRLSSLFYPSQMSAYVHLLREGVGEADVLAGASLTIDAVRLAGKAPSAAAALLARPEAAVLARAERYGLVCIGSALVNADRDRGSELVSTLHEIARDTPLLWPLSPRVAALLQALGLRQAVEHERIVIVEPVDFIDEVALMQRASLVVADSHDARQQAAALRVRCLGVGAAGLQAEPASPSEGAPADRIAEHLAAWMAARRLAAISDASRR
jgi:UDP-N-acetylglucosamine 2-epimerase